MSISINALGCTAEVLFSACSLHADELIAVLSEITEDATLPPKYTR